ncbi:hypothetical protein [Williamsia sp. CHRR-6]|uniref:hypothetical protein n=1 Tax=Williamsia sp. CHRR-6 TaxID=2835871 RepID=UPI001BDA71BB|nr:hypothetical protein [Williamsia sp. CHRR-6]MBT0567805.1 hypothetical protein [Williamsia sp. CHRR-6]
MADSARARALSTMGSVNTAAMLCGYLIGAPVVAVLGPAGGLVLAGLGTTTMVGMGVAVTWWLTHRRPAQHQTGLTHPGPQIPVSPDRT